MSVHGDRLERRGTRQGLVWGGGAALAGRCVRGRRAQGLGRVRQERGNVVRQSRQAGHRRRGGLDRDGDGR